MCNEPKAFQPAYRRLPPRISGHLKFGEVPIKLYLKKRAPATSGTKSSPKQRRVVARMNNHGPPGQNGRRRGCAISDYRGCAGGGWGSDSVVEEGSSRVRFLEVVA